MYVYIVHMQRSMFFSGVLWQMFTARGGYAFSAPKRPPWTPNVTCHATTGGSPWGFGSVSPGNLVFSQRLRQKPSLIRVQSKVKCRTSSPKLSKTANKKHKLQIDSVRNCIPMICPVSSLPWLEFFPQQAMAALPWQATRGPTALSLTSSLRLEGWNGEHWVSRVSNAVPSL